MPRITKSAAAVYLASESLCLAFVKAKAEPVNVSIQVMNPDIIGDAARIHGYVAREGLGITRMRNHRVEPMPSTIKLNFVQWLFAV